jgi:tripartite-type tricarboxylate transporter receptor subunit TctC
VPSQAGGGADIVARILGHKLTEAWGQQVVVDNRIGAVGAEIAAKAVPDGYTIMFTTSALAVRDSLYANLPYNTLRDFQPVTQVLTQSNVLVVHPSVPAKTVKELIAYAKTRPGQLNYGSGETARRTTLRARSSSCSRTSMWCTFRSKAYPRRSPTPSPAACTTRWAARFPRSPT